MSEKQKGWPDNVMLLRLRTPTGIVLLVPLYSSGPHKKRSEEYLAELKRDGCVPASNPHQTVTAGLDHEPRG